MEILVLKNTIIMRKITPIIQYKISIFATGLF